MSDLTLLSVKKFPFKKYDVFLEINKRKLKDGKVVYNYHRFAQQHPVKNRSVPPYDQTTSKDFDLAWEAVVAGYKSVAIF